MNFNQQFGVVINKPIGLIGKSMDLRSQMSRDFIFRDYTSLAEALEWLTVPGDAPATEELRKGHFPIYVTAAGVTKVYCFLHGLEDADAIEMFGPDDILEAENNFTGNTNTFETVNIQNELLVGESIGANGVVWSFVGGFKFPDGSLQMTSAAAGIAAAIAAAAVAHAAAVAAAASAAAASAAAAAASAANTATNTALATTNTDVDAVEAALELTAKLAEINIFTNINNFDMLAYYSGGIYMNDGSELTMLQDIGTLAQSINANYNGQAYFSIRFAVSGAYGGTSANINGRSYEIYDHVAAKRRFAINALGEVWFGDSQAEHTFSVVAGVVRIPALGVAAAPDKYLGYNEYGQLKAIPDPAKVDSHSPLTYGAAIALDFASADNMRTINVTGNVTFSTSNRASAKSRVYRLINDATAHTWIWPAGWTWIGAAAPAGIAISKTAILSLTAFGTADTDIVAAYSVQI